MYSQSDEIVQGVKIHYYRTGSGQTSIVLLHGASDNGLCWTPVAELLSREYDVVMPDAPGHGLSDRLRPGYTFHEQAVQTAGLIQALSLNKPIIIGHSMGAGTAVNVAVNYPELPRAIILEDPAWRRPEYETSEDPRKRAQERESFARAIIGWSDLPREVLVAECRKANPGWSESEIAPWVDAKFQFDHRFFSTMQLERPTYRKLVPQIRCPALLITSDGGIVQPAVAREALSLSRSRGQLQWKFITGAGHNIRREQFKVFYETISDFIKNNN